MQFDLPHVSVSRNEEVAVAHTNSNIKLGLPAFELVTVMQEPATKPLAAPEPFPVQGVPPLLQQISTSLIAARNIETHPSPEFVQDPMSFPNPSIGDLATSEHFAIPAQTSLLMDDDQGQWHQDLDPPFDAGWEEEPDRKRAGVDFVSPQPPRDAPLEFPTKRPDLAPPQIGSKTETAPKSDEVRVIVERPLGTAPNLEPPLQTYPDLYGTDAETVDPLSAIHSDQPPIPQPNVGNTSDVEEEKSTPDRTQNTQLQNNMSGPEAAPPTLYLGDEGNGGSDDSFQAQQLQVPDPLETDPGFYAATFGAHPRPEANAVSFPQTKDSPSSLGQLAPLGPQDPVNASALPETRSPTPHSSPKTYPLAETGRRRGEAERVATQEGTLVAINNIREPVALTPHMAAVSIQQNPQEGPQAPIGDLERPQKLQTPRPSEVTSPIADGRKANDAHLSSRRNLGDRSLVLPAANQLDMRPLITAPKQQVSGNSVTDHPAVIPAQPVADVPNKTQTNQVYQRPDFGTGLYRDNDLAGRNPRLPDARHLQRFATGLPKTSMQGPVQTDPILTAEDQAATKPALAREVVGSTFPKTVAEYSTHRFDNRETLPQPIEGRRNPVAALTGPPSGTLATLQNSSEIASQPAFGRPFDPALVEVDLPSMSPNEKPTQDVAAPTAPPTNTASVASSAARPARQLQEDEARYWPVLASPEDARDPKPEIAPSSSAQFVSQTQHPAASASHSAQLGHAIARQIAMAIGPADPNAPIELTLDPPELGSVRITAVQSDGGVTLQVHAERQETLDLMRRHSDLLDREFFGQGLENASFSFSGGREEHREGAASQPSVKSMGIEDPQQNLVELSLEAGSGLDIRI